MAKIGNDKSGIVIEFQCIGVPHERHKLCGDEKIERTFNATVLMIKLEITYFLSS